MLSVSCGAMLYTISVSNMILMHALMCVMGILTCKYYISLSPLAIHSHSQSSKKHRSYNFLFPCLLFSPSQFSHPWVPSLTSSPGCMLCPAGASIGTRCCWAGCRTSRWRVGRSIWWWWVPRAHCGALEAVRCLRPWALDDPGGKVQLAAHSFTFHF